LEIEKRPIHCSDQKRRIMHIKDNDEWHKDDNCEKIKSTIDSLATKQLSNFNLWEKEKVEYMNSKNGQEDYMQLVSNITKEVLTDDKGTNKIIGLIAKEVSI
jgi:acetyl-CoA carboxylase alpha subunit